MPRPKRPSEIPFGTKVQDAVFYEGLDPGIRFAVRVLHFAGFETQQSCQGGPDPARPDRGHAYEVPTVDLPCGTNDARGFAALHALGEYGLPVRDISIVWPVHNGQPYEKLWRITFARTMEDRKDDIPIFVVGHQAQ